MANSKFKIGDKCAFKRDKDTKKNKAVIVGVLEMENGEESRYVIEYDKGWTPNEGRMAQFGLESDKKYLFVLESELTKSKSIF